MSSVSASSQAQVHELEFERPLIALERQIAELEASQQAGQVDLGEELARLRQSHTDMLRKIYAGLSAWNTVKVARHPNRPQAVDYIERFVKDFAELHGDRRYGDDPAVLSGFGRIGPHKLVLIAHNKGKDTRQRLACHFGCAHPEGYRKALRCMKLAEKFNLPVVTLIDTPGAFPGIGAEERGQAEAIALNLREMARLRVPVLSIVIGEGASGGALGIGVGDRLAMMQYAWYSVISPEGCAAILWKTATPQTNEQAAHALKLTAANNLENGAIDDIIDEPLGGAHRNPEAAADTLQRWIVKQLRELKKQNLDTLLEKRYRRLRQIGEYEEAFAEAPSAYPASTTNPTRDEPRP